MIQSVADIHEIEIIVYNRSTVLRHLVNIMDSCKLLTLYIYHLYIVFSEYLE